MEKFDRQEAERPIKTALSSWDKISVRTKKEQ